MPKVKDENYAGNSGVAADRLRSLVERIERLEEEKKALGGDIKDLFSEAKSSGFDTKALKRVIQLRKMDPADRDELDMLVDTYDRALSGHGVTAARQQEDDEL